MKRELPALLLLLLLAAGALWNLSRIDRLIGDIEEALDRSAAAEAPIEALRCADEALARWLQAEGYTHIFLRHPEIDAVSDAFYDYRERLLSRDGSEAALEKLLYHLESIRTMEHPRPGSVF